MSIVLKIIALFGAPTFDYLVVGAGAGGGGTGGHPGKGGSGGQVVQGTVAAISGLSLTVTVGASVGEETPGNASSLGSVATAAGGLRSNLDGAGVDGPSSAISGASVIYGSSGGEMGTVGGSGAGNGRIPGPTTGAVANRGGGGGGNDLGAGGTSGSGVVIVRYVTGTASATGGTITTGGGYTIHTFTTSGTFAVI